jgi:uncharacterized protein YjbJ (UPF0337 family)
MNKAKGKANELAGKGRQALGDATGNEEMEAKGEAQEAKGKMQGMAGKVEEGFDKAKDKVKDATN